MGKKVIMIGQFPPLITGEATSNKLVLDTLSNFGFTVRYVNTCIIKNANDVGRFSIYKLFLAIWLSVKSLFYVSLSDIVYVTPGQTLLGFIRFIPTLALSYILKKKLILHWHGYGIYYFLKVYRCFIGFVFNQKSINVLLTSDLYEKISVLGADVNKVKVVSNFVTLQEIYAADLMASQERKLNVLYLSSLMPEKGFNTFIEACSKTDKFDFYVCGSGSENQIKLVETAQNNGFVKYLGVITGKEKEDIFSKTDVFVLPTSYITEGVPLTILEAMSFGCAIVTTRHNGIPETVECSAMFINQNDPDDLLNALYSLDMDREFLFDIKLKSYRRSRHFSETVFKEKLINLFLSA